jgi:hypothetical protein
MSLPYLIVLEYDILRDDNVIVPSMLPVTQCHPPRYPHRYQQYYRNIIIDIDYYY